MIASPTSKATIQDLQISYELIRTARKTVAISVYPDINVTVRAPDGMKREDVDRIVRKNIVWIRREQIRYAALPLRPIPREWVPGETHRYLGRQYRLKISRGQYESVRLSGQYFVVTTRTCCNRQRIGNAMKAWYRERALAYLSDKVINLLKASTWLDDVLMPRVLVRSMSNRWASTTRNGCIYFNSDVVKLPIGCIEYLVMHELVHLKVANHGPMYWNLLNKCMPDWIKWRCRLNSAEI